MPFASLTLDLDITFICVLALFLIPLVGLNALVFGPFLKVFEKRHDQLEGAIERAEKRLGEAEQKAKTFEARIAQATAQGLEVRGAIRGEAEAAMRARVDGERAKLQKKVEAALGEVERSRAAAALELRSSSERLANDMAAKLLGRAL